MIGTSDMPPYLQVLRPHQWVKNLLVLIPLFFTERAFELTGWLAALTALGSFCFAASSIYLLNDILDRREDALHPKKRSRPIASGRLPVGAAWMTLAITLGVAAALASLHACATDPSVPRAARLADETHRRMHTHGGVHVYTCTLSTKTSPCQWFS